MNLLAKLIARTQKTETCWLWVGTINPGGYGLFSVYKDGVKAYTSGAHRLMYEAMVGPIPEGLTIDHLCRVRNCVNPDHLEPVTRYENVMRGVGPTAVNRRRQTCARGHGLVPDSRGTRRCDVCARLRAERKQALPASEKPHGTANCYSNYGCRRAECRAAYDKTRARNRKAIA